MASNLALALHVFLLDERDCERLGGLLPARLRAAAKQFDDFRRRATFPVWSTHGVAATALSRVAVTLFATAWIAASLATAGVHFSTNEEMRRVLLPIENSYGWLRVANAYHLFGHITRERVELGWTSRSGSMGCNKRRAVEGSGTCVGPRSTR